MQKSSQTGLLLLLALLGVVALPTSHQARLEPDLPKDATASAPGGTAHVADTGLMSLCARLGLEAQCLKQRSAWPTSIVPVIVTLPDPQRSGIPLYFDEGLDAVETSIEAAGFRRQAFWLPWHRAATSSHEFSEGQPGWIVYRGARPHIEGVTLLVLVVAEWPFRGIDREAFAVALQVLQTLDPESRPRILAPFFSGSARSLWTELGRVPAQVITGSATAELSPPPQVDFARTIVPDAEMLPFVLRQLTQRHRGLVSVAVLSESSAYGDINLRAITNVRWGQFRFPPHLAQLRVARAAEAVKADKDATQRPSLHLSLQQDARDVPDVLPSMSEQRPRTIELSLRATLREIARRDFNYLLIVATDPRDLMYLAQEARLYCPRTRLVTLGAHALYTHPELWRDFAGMLVGTSYPLFLNNQTWAEHGPNPRSGGSRSFTNETTQGVYNAMQRLLGSIPGVSPELLDYTTHPSMGRTLVGPSRWLLEVFNGRFWPLKVEGARLGGADWHLPQVLIQPEPSSKDSALHLWNGRTSSFLGGLGILWASLGLLHLVMLFARDASWPLRVPIVRFFARRNWAGSSAGEQYWVAANWVHAFSGCCITLVGLRNERDPWLTLWSAVLVGVVLSAGAANFELGSTINADATQLWLAMREARGRRWRASYPAAASMLVSLWMLVLSAVATWCVGALAAQLWGSSGRLLIARLADPLGMCALWPLLLLAAGLYLWAVFGLARVSAIQRFPRENPFSADSINPRARLSQLTLQAPPAFRARIRGFELAGAGLVLFMSYHVWANLMPTLEWSGFDCALICALCTLAAGTQFAAIQATILWNTLRHLLVRLAATGMVDAYERVGNKVSGSFGLHLRSHVPNVDELAVSLRSLYVLARAAARMDETGEVEREIRAAGPSLLDQAELLESELGGTSLDAIGLPVSDASDPARARTIHRAFFQAAQTLTRTVERVRALRSQAPDLAIGELAAPEELLTGGKFGHVPTVSLIASGGTQEVRLWLRAAEDFIAMRHATFIYHTIDQIRHCLGFAIVGALALMFAAFSYPFHPPRFVTLSAASLLLLIVGAAMRVIVAMERNELLRRLARAQPGSPHLNASLLSQLATYVAVPLLLLLSRAFPDVSEALAGVLQPLFAVLQ